MAHFYDYKAAAAAVDDRSAVPFADFYADKTAAAVDRTVDSLLLDDLEVVEDVLQHSRLYLHNLAVDRDTRLNGLTVVGDVPYGNRLHQLHNLAVDDDDDKTDVRLDNDVVAAAVVEDYDSKIDAPQKTRGLEVYYEKNRSEV